MGISKTDIELKIVQEKQRLLNYEGIDKIVSSEEKAREISKQRELEKRHPKMMSDIPTLDTMIEGFRLGTVNVISGPTGEGKSTFTRTLVKNLSEYNPTLFSFEDGVEETFEHYGVNVPIFYLPNEIPENSNNIRWIRERILEAQAKYNSKAIFIDHLHYIQDMQGLGDQMNASLLIGDIMRKLKLLAGTLRIAIFLVAHTKTESQSKAELKKYFTKDDIRDSSFVKQEADTVMMIWRMRKKSTINEIGWEYTNHAILNLDKHRRTGKVGFVKLNHFEGLFQELTDNYEPPIDYEQIEREAEQHITKEDIKLF